MRSTTEKVVVVASRPDVPIKGMEVLAGCEVYWVGLNDHVSLKELLVEVPRVLTVPGWRFPLFNRFRDEVHAAGGKVIAGVDNNYSFSFKNIAKSIQFRFLYAKRYDGFWVPGMSGFKLMRFYGVEGSKIYQGSYSADQTLFTDGVGLSNREKRLLYVGQFIERKNVKMLCEAFIHANDIVKCGWTLELCGSGKLKSELPNDPSIVINDFVQPECLADKYRSARAFILPSKEEHWGLVVHEAALSGCVLLLSDRVGAADDFLLEGVNGFSFSPSSIVDMTAAIVKIMRLNDMQLNVAQKKSLELGQKISTQSFVTSVQRFVGAHI